MILKASQRGGALRLARHLLNAMDNEHVEVREVRGFVSADVAGALQEAYAVSRGTRCTRFLFSLSLSPPPGEAVPVAVYKNALERIEAALGLQGQPRIVVFHEKHGRRHGHAVWSRIDATAMTARALPWFKLRLRDIARALFLEHGWDMPPGLAKRGGRDPVNYTLAEGQQAARKGRDAGDLKRAVQACWAASDSHAAFVHALREHGLRLAKGDRRGHVAVTPEGVVVPVARAIGKPAREVRARLGAADDLPGVEAARAAFAADLRTAFTRCAHATNHRKARDLAALETLKDRMTCRHRDERAALDNDQEERRLRETRARSARLNRGLKGLWERINGRHARIRQQNEREADAADRRDRDERQALIEAHLKERQALQARIKAARDHHAAILRDIRRERPPAQSPPPAPFRPPAPAPGPEVA